MAEEKQVKGSLFRCYGDGIEPGLITTVWAVYQLDDAGALIRIHHACLSELEAQATKSLAEAEGVITIALEQITVICDSNYNAYVVGPGVEVMATQEVTDAVRERAKTKLDPAELELLGLE